MVPTAFTFRSPGQGERLEQLCRAKFTDEPHMHEVLNELVTAIHITEPPYEEGADGLDYVKKALEWLSGGERIDEVPAKFTTLYEENHERIWAVVWPSPPTTITELRNIFSYELRRWDNFSGSNSIPKAGR